jgi:hypothetical protein
VATCRARVCNRFKLHSQQTCPRNFFHTFLSPFIQLPALSCKAGRHWARHHRKQDDRSSKHSPTSAAPSVSRREKFGGLTICLRAGYVKSCGSVTISQVCRILRSPARKQGDSRPNLSQPCQGRSRARTGAPSVSAGTKPRRTAAPSVSAGTKPRRTAAPSVSAGTLLPFLYRCSWNL